MMASNAGRGVINAERAEFVIAWWVAQARPSLKSFARKLARR